MVVISDIVTIFLCELDGDELSATSHVLPLLHPPRPAWAANRGQWSRSKAEGVQPRQLLALCQWILLAKGHSLYNLVNKFKSVIIGANSLKSDAKTANKEPVSFVKSYFLYYAAQLLTILRCAGL